MEILVFWLALCVLVGVIATIKGRSGVGWFLLAFVFSPLIAGIIVILIGPSHSQVVKNQTVMTGGGSVADEIGKLAALRDSGALTALEFERQRAALLVRPASGRPVPAGWSQKDVGG